MERMIAAIERAILADNATQQDKASRWAAAWGLLGGIRSPGIRLRRSVLRDDTHTERHALNDHGWRVERRAHPR
ncbi:MAG: hypothetical protein ACLGI6_12365 [Gammaproteobacteria bacterium]